jgi:hypothetical protein
MKNKSLQLFGLFIFLGSCSGDFRTHKDPQQKPTYTPNRTPKVDLLRSRQRVMRYDCDGKLTSDKVEEVHTANASVNLEPLSENLDYYTSKFHNKTTNQDKSFGWSSTSFYVDISKQAAMAMGVDVGKNIIEYKYLKCDEWSTPDDKGEKKCLKDSPAEEGTWELEVTFREENLNDTKEERPSPESCKNYKF